MYNGWADIYDALYGGQGQNADIPFLLKLVKEYGGPVLECACGTGRVAIPVAKEGFEIHGIDTSAEMLGVLRKKLLSLPPVVRKRISFEKKDMRHFVLNRKFKTCIIAFNSLYHLKNDFEMMKFFRCVNDSLEEKGVLIIDVFEFDPDTPQGKFGLQTEIKDPNGRTIRKYSKTLFGENQINDNWFRIVIENRGKKQTINRRFKLHYLLHDQMWKLLETKGFRVIKTYGNYNSEPYQHERQNERMIFVAEKARKV